MGGKIRFEACVTLPGEDWRKFSGFGCDHYEVSSLGRVRKIVDRLGRPLTVPTLVHGKPHRTKRYLRVKLSVKSVCKERAVHHLVLLAFVGERPDGHEADHIDADRTNNTPANLRWVTHADNLAHKVALGNHARISPETVRSIREDFGGITNVEVGRRLDIHQSTVARIRTRETRREVL